MRRRTLDALESLPVRQDGGVSWQVVSWRLWCRPLGGH